jgi:hypothetical protein
MDFILEAIDTEIAKLQAARSLLSGSQGTTTAKTHKPGGINLAASAEPKTRVKRRKMSKEARDKISVAIKARWAVRKKAAGKKPT